MFLPAVGRRPPPAMLLDQRGPDQLILTFLKIGRLIGLPSVSPAFLDTRGRPVSRVPSAKRASGPWCFNPSIPHQGALDKRSVELQYCKVSLQ